MAKRLTTIATLSVASLLLTSCSGTNTSAPSQSVPQLSLPHHRPTAAELGLWPKPGPSKRVCAPRRGFASCEALIRTDIHAGPDTTLPLGYAPSDLWNAYGIKPINMPGQTIAIVVAGDDPYVENDLASYRNFFGLPPCTLVNGCFKKIGCPQGGLCIVGNWPHEISIDTQMVSAICPNCKIVLVEAASASTFDLVTAEITATQQAHFVSNSWNNQNPGETGQQQYDYAFNVPGVLITDSSGDFYHQRDGSVTPVYWPQILPSVVSVGGTTLTLNPRFEKAWSSDSHATGSACSTIYSQPAFQNGLNTGCTTPMRATSDVSAVADPDTGVAIYDSYNYPSEPWQVAGGTSVASPIINSFFALADDTSGGVHLYQNKGFLYDVITGSNGGGPLGDCGHPLCDAGPGWDGPTGLGTPNGLSAF